MKGVIKTFNRKGLLLQQWSFNSKEAFQKAHAYVMENCKGKIEFTFYSKEK